MITEVLINASGQTGIYHDEGGHPMLGSALGGTGASETENCRPFVVSELMSPRKGED